LVFNASSLFDRSYTVPCRLSTLSIVSMQVWLVLVFRRMWRLFPKISSMQFHDALPLELQRFKSILPMHYAFSVESWRCQTLEMIIVKKSRKSRYMVAILIKWIKPVFIFCGIAIIHVYWSSNS
jgi:hypothetical protein